MASKEDPELQQQVQELQVLEQNLQNLLMQKQAFQMELNETLNALEEVRKSDDDVYKVIGSVMVKGDKKAISSDLEEKKRLLEVRSESIEKQEKLLESKATELKTKTQEALSGKK